VRVAGEREGREDGEEGKQAGAECDDYEVIRTEKELLEEQPAATGVQAGVDVGVTCKDVNMIVDFFIILVIN
jgi:hypothetical protein